LYTEWVEQEGCEFNRVLYRWEEDKEAAMKALQEQMVQEEAMEWAKAQYMQLLNDRPDLRDRAAHFF
jgi:hypothetical protein